MISALPIRPQFTNGTCDNLESVLTELWQDVFGFSPIGLQDDFFELGGNSLHAARLVAKIHTLTGRDLPFESFLYAPTIERLTLLIRAEETVSATTLVTLREGNRERPLFFAHSMSGILLELWALARGMECDCAVYGIQGRGFREDEVPNSSVEEMAADYVQQIRSVQPHGPYAVAGFSMGGLIALEIAQQLSQCGETVEVVALIDTQLDEQCLTSHDWLLHQLRRASLELHEIRARSWPERASYILLKAGHFADRLRVLTGKSPKRSGVDERALRGVLTLSPRQRRIILDLRVAMAAYRPKPYSGRVTFFHAGVANPRWPDPLRIWKGLCPQLEVVEVQGGHSQLIQPPCVAHVAQALDRLIDFKNPRRSPELQEEPSVVPLLRQGITPTPVDIESPGLAPAVHAFCEPAPLDTSAVDSALDTLQGAATSAFPLLELTVVIPTYKERENIAPLVSALTTALQGVKWEVLFVDDHSPDHTADAIRALAVSNRRIRIIERIGRRGLSSACIEGMLASPAPYIAVMDADMQHDESILPEMLRLLRARNLDVVVASRNTNGGSMGEFARERVRLSNLGSRVSKLVCNCDVTDPMSGFFLVDSRFFRFLAPHLTGAGFKLLVDILASSPTPPRIAELPYRFGKRVTGESKLDVNVELEYLFLIIDKILGKHLPTRFVLFVCVGAFGLLLHLGILGVFHLLSIATFPVGQVFATLSAMTFNYFVNNLVTFRDLRLRGIALLGGLCTFYLACTLGVLVNVSFADRLLAAGLPWYLAGVSGLALSSIWNYGVSTVVTWRRGRKSYDIAAGKSEEIARPVYPKTAA
jgi:dolichol-phosphate mannosyltransferase